MKTTNNISLIIGGSAGIGLEVAKLFSGKGNKVIITGRNEKRLEEAAASLEDATTIVSDIADAVHTDILVATIKKDFSGLNIVINNAAAANLYSVVKDDEDVFAKASEEMHTNYLSVIRLTEKLLPVLKQQPEPL